MLRKLIISLSIIAMFTTIIPSCVVADDAKRILDALYKSIAQADSLEAMTVAVSRTRQEGVCFLRKQSSAYEVSIQKSDGVIYEATVYQADKKSSGSFTTTYYPGKEPEKTAKKGETVAMILNLLWDSLLYSRESLKELAVGEKKSFDGSDWLSLVEKCNLHSFNDDLTRPRGNFELLISPDYQKWIEIYTAEDGKYMAVRVGALGTVFDLPKLELSSELEIEQYISDKLRQTVIWEMPIGEWLKLGS